MTFGISHVVGIEQHRLFLCGSSFVLAADGSIVVTYRFEIESPGFHPKTRNEMSPEQRPPEATACAAFGESCSMAEPIEAIVVSHNQQGEDDSGIIRAPVDYEICRAEINWKHAEIDQSSTFNTVILRESSRNGLGFYTVVPRHRPYPSYIKDDIYLEFVRTGTTGQHDCWPANVNPWLVNRGNAKFYPGASID
jgi:hypothetical protein